MESNNENETTYDAQFWELEYVIHRYLRRLDEQTLRVRCDGKEYQTRLEFALRNVPLHRALPVIDKRDLSGAPARPRHPNGGDVLFRYGEQKLLHDLVQFGHLRIKAARDYALMENDLARRDDELVKHSYSPGEYVTLTFPDGRTSSPIGDLRYSVTGTDYYVYYVANDWDPDFFPISMQMHASSYTIQTNLLAVSVLPPP